MKKKVVIYGDPTQVDKVATVLVNANLELDIHFIEDHSFNEANFDRLVTLSVLAPNIKLTRSPMAYFKEADLLLLVDLVPATTDTAMKEFVATNLPEFREVISHAMSQGFAGQICSLQTYDEIWTYLAWKFSGLPQHQIFGLGTFTATLVLQRLLQAQFHVGDHDVRTYVLGTFAQPTIIWSRTMIGGFPLLRLIADTHNELDATLLTQLSQRLNTLLTQDAQALAIRSLPRLLRGLTHETGFISALTVLTEADTKQLSYSLPIYLNQNGIREFMTVSLTEAEQEAVTASYQVGRELLTQIEAGKLEGK